SDEEGLRPAGIQDLLTELAQDRVVVHERAGSCQRGLRLSAMLKHRRDRLQQPQPLAFLPGKLEQLRRQLDKPRPWYMANDVPQFALGDLREQVERNEILPRTGQEGVGEKRRQRRVREQHERLEHRPRANLAVATSFCHRADHIARRVYDAHTPAATPPATSARAAPAPTLPSASV